MLLLKRTSLVEGGGLLISMRLAHNDFPWKAYASNRRLIPSLTRTALVGARLRPLCAATTAAEGRV